MKKLKVLAHCNVWANSGGTRNFVPFLDSKLIDINMSCFGIGSLENYFDRDRCIPLDGFSRNVLSEGFNQEVRDLTSGMDIVIDAMGGAIPDKREASLLYHVDAPIKIAYGVFSITMPPELSYEYDAYYTTSLDLFHTEPDNIPFNDLVHCLYYSIFPSKASKKSRDKIRSKFGIPKDAFVVGSTLCDDTLNRWVMTEFNKLHPETYFLTTADYSVPHRFINSEIPKNFKHNAAVVPNEVDELLSAFDVLIHTRMETFGSAVYEAFAAGVPVVCRWGGSWNSYAECIYPNAGYLAGHGEDDLERSVHDCVKALEHVYQNYSEAKERAALAKQRVTKWLPKNVVPQYERLFASLALKKGILTPEEAAPYTSIETSPTKEDFLNWKHNIRPEIQERLSRVPFI